MGRSNARGEGGGMGRVQGRWRVATALGVVLGWAGLAHAGPAPSFAEVVSRNFRAWDLDQDGALETVEIDRLMNAPGIQGDAAAALATIKLRERHLPADQRARFAVGLDELSGRVESRWGVVNPDSAHGEPPKPFHYETVFRRQRDALAQTPHRLFAGEGPNFASLRQGPIGDCFFFSVVGGIAAREPRRIAAMFEPADDGACFVHFPGGRRVRVPRLTQAEALVNNSSSSLHDGLWVAVLEKAVGEILRDHARPDRRTAEATDAIAHGGSTVRMLRLFTGHATIEFTFRDPGQQYEALARIRRALPEAFHDGRHAAVSMGSKPAGPRKIPALGYGHAYALLAYDHRDDHVTLWNPWGNTFTPKGPEGPDHGYATQHGLFRVPLETLYRNWSSLHIESRNN